MAPPVAPHHHRRGVRLEPAGGVFRGHPLPRVEHPPEALILWALKAAVLEDSSRPILPCPVRSAYPAIPNSCRRWLWAGPMRHVRTTIRSWASIAGRWKRSGRLRPMLTPPPGAADAQVLADAESLIAAWNERQGGWRCGKARAHPWPMPSLGSPASIRYLSSRRRSPLWVRVETAGLVA